MTRYVSFNEDGAAYMVAEYAESVNADGVLVPESVSHLSDEALLQTLYLKSGNVCQRPEKPNQFCFWDFQLEHWVEDTVSASSFYLGEVDHLAEEARSKVATPGSGQAMTYEVKHQEALAGGGRMLQAEAEALGMTLQEVVDSVLAARQAWLVAGGQIEVARLKAKKDIRAATTAGEMHQITEALRQELSL